MCLQNIAQVNCKNCTIWKEFLPQWNWKYILQWKKRSFFVIYGGWWQIPDFYLKLVIEYLIVARPLFKLRVDSFFKSLQFFVLEISPLINHLRVKIGVLVRNGEISQKSCGKERTVIKLIRGTISPTQQFGLLYIYFYFYPKKDFCNLHSNGLFCATY